MAKNQISAPEIPPYQHNHRTTQAIPWLNRTRKGSRFENLSTIFRSQYFEFVAVCLQYVGVLTRKCHTAELGYAHDHQRHSRLPEFGRTIMWKISRARLNHALNDTALALMVEAQSLAPDEAKKLTDLATRLDEVRVKLAQKSAIEHSSDWPCSSAA